MGNCKQSGWCYWRARAVGPRRGSRLAARAGRLRRSIADSVTGLQYSSFGRLENKHPLSVETARRRDEGKAPVCFAPVEFDS